LADIVPSSYLVATPQVRSVTREVAKKPPVLADPVRLPLRNASRLSDEAYR
jgi:hypothetical protein